MSERKYLTVTRKPSNIRIGDQLPVGGNNYEVVGVMGSDDHSCIDIVLSLDMHTRRCTVTTWADQVVTFRQVRRKWADICEMVCHDDAAEVAKR